MSAVTGYQSILIYRNSYLTIQKKNIQIFKLLGTTGFGLGAGGVGYYLASLLFATNPIAIGVGITLGTLLATIFNIKIMGWNSL